MSFVGLENYSHRFFCYLRIDIMIIIFVFLFTSCPCSSLSAVHFSLPSVSIPSPVTLCHLLAKLGAKPGCKSCPTGLECRGSRGPWLNWQMHHRVWGMTPWCQTQDPSNITNLTERRKLVMGDAASIWNPEKGFFFSVLFQTSLSLEHVILMVDYFLIIAAPAQRFVSSNFDFTPKWTCIWIVTKAIHIAPGKPQLGLFQAFSSGTEGLFLKLKDVQVPWTLALWGGHRHLRWKQGIIS